jgi:thiol-activated cytolysin
MTTHSITFARKLTFLLAMLPALACAGGGDMGEADDAALEDGADDAPADGADDGDGDGGDGDDGDGDGDDDGTPGGGPSTKDRINDYIQMLGTPQAPADDVVEGEAGPQEESGDYMCSTQNLEQTEQFDKIVAFAANSGSMYPGAIIGADSVDTGLFTPKVLGRAPLTFSASLEGVVAGEVSATLEEPSLSSFRDAMGQILDQNVVGQTPANIFAQIEEVYSSEQLSLALGVNVQWLAGGIESSFGFGQEETRSRFVVNFTQSYYTVDVDPPGTAADFFSDDVTLDEVIEKIDDEPPTYVSSVTYGRMVYFAVTSEFSSQELRAALDFGFKGTVSVDGSVSLTHEEVLENSEITAYILGGNGEIAVQAIYGVDELRAFIESGGTWSKDSPGAAIAYKLAYMHDDSAARYSLTTDYELTECERVSQNVRVAVSNVRVINDGGDGGEELELYGDIWVEDGNGDVHWLWTQPSGNPVTIGTGMSYPQNGELGSSIIPVTPQPGEELILYVDLEEDDGTFNGADSMGTQVVARPFEDGWRAEISVPAANGDQHIEINFDLRPVN